MEPLPRPSIDTVRIERILPILRDRFDLRHDVLAPSSRPPSPHGVTYGGGRAAESGLHPRRPRRAITMSCRTGLPTNEGRGYVLRRLMTSRRAGRHAASGTTRRSPGPGASLSSDGRAVSRAVENLGLVQEGSSVKSAGSTGRCHRLSSRRRNGRSLRATGAPPARRARLPLTTPPAFRSTDRGARSRAGAHRRAGRLSTRRWKSSAPPPAAAPPGPTAAYRLLLDDWPDDLVGPAHYHSPPGTPCSPRSSRTGDLLDRTPFYARRCQVGDTGHHRPPRRRAVVYAPAGPARPRRPTGARRGRDLRDQDPSPPSTVSRVNATRRQHTGHTCCTRPAPGAGDQSARRVARRAGRCGFRFSHTRLAPKSSRPLVAAVARTKTVSPTTSPHHEATKSRRGHGRVAFFGGTSTHVVRVVRGSP